MKKKIAHFGIIALLLFSSPIAIFAQTGRADAIFRIFDSGTFYMKSRVLAGDTAADVETYTKDGMMASTVTVQGQQISRTILRDNKMHVIMDAQGMVMVMPPEAGVEVPGREGVNTNGMKPSGSGTAQFNGRSMPYEEYRDAKGNRVQYFLDGARLAGIRSIIGRDAIDIVVSELNQNVPNNVFDIPRGYQVMDMSALGGLF